MRKVFALFGTIALDGVSTVNKQLSSMDKSFKEFSKKVTKSGKQLQKLGTGMSKNITAPIAAATAAITALSIKTGQYADKLLDLEQITGISTAGLQRFEHLARIAGVNFETLTGAATKFIARIPQIEKGTSDTAKSFDELGINLRNSDGELRSMDELFPEIIKKLQNISNVTERNAIAQQLFSKSLNDLAPVMGMTNEQLDQAFQEAEDLGLIMSKDSLNAANDFRIEIEKLQKQMSFLGAEIGISFLPILKDIIIPFIKNQIVPAFKSFAERIQNVANWFNNLNPQLKNIIMGITGFAAVLGPALIGLGKLLVLLGSLRNAILLVNAAFTANPIGLVTVAVVALGVAIYNLTKNYKNVNAELEKNQKFLKDDIANTRLQTQIGIIEELIYNYDKLARVNELNLTNDELRETNNQIDILETNLGDFGIAFEGGFVRRIELARNKLKELKGEVKDSEEVFEPAVIKGKSDAEIKREIEAEENARLEAKAAKLQEEITLQEKHNQELIEVNKIVDDNLNEMQKERLENEKKTNEELRKEKEKNQKADEEAIAAANERYKNHQRIFKETVVDSVFQAGGIITGFFENQMISADNAYKKRKEYIENNVEDEEERSKQLNALEKQYQTKREDIQRKQALIDKAQALFSIALNTATSISRVLWNPILVGVVSALGAAQAALVASKPIPLQKGGYTEGSASGTLGMFGERNTEELILPLDIGINKLATSLVEKLGSMTLSGDNNAAALTGAKSNKNFTLNIGTFIGDDRGIKELTRKIIPILNSENQRKGQPVYV